ncbi:protein CIP2A homolog [Mya arenaria]|uniref:protein CIP2A homolog n=1 Tax=Mya arenaria TaxID=6604 RepID=UPI0022E66225|nr:protein CIP2A homolog [Mya arenaria]XP_052811988.1 protein CIP2A homolog [Mya arenaria]
METAPNLLKSVVVATSQYVGHKIERNLVFLQRQIDVLISKTSRGCSLKFFNPSEVLPAECITCLVNIVSDPSTKSTLVLKCLLLFNNLVSDSLIRASLHEKFYLTPALVSVIRHHGSSSGDTLTVEALHLLQKITYGQRISFEESFMEDLLHFLLTHVAYPTTGFTQPSMGVLVNLTRDNFSVLSYIKNNENIADLARTLTKLLGDQPQTMVLFSLTLLLNVCSQEKVGGKFFTDTNAPRTFQMIFNMLMDADSGEVRKYAVDLMKDAMKVARLQRSLALYEYLDTCLEQTLTLLTTSSQDSAIKIFELLTTLCQEKEVRIKVCKAMLATFQIQDQKTFPNLAKTPLSQIADPLLATIHWSGQSTDTYGRTPLAALDLLHEIYEALVFSHDRIHHEKHISAVLPTVLQTLSVPLDGDNATIQRRCEAMVKCVKLLNTFCHDDSFLTLISKNVPHGVLNKLLCYQFEHNHVALKTSTQPPSDDWSTTGVDLVLHLLDLIGRLNSSSLEDLFMLVMQDTQVVPFLACGLGSTNRQRVQQTMEIIVLGAKLEGFPTVILSDALVYNNSGRDSQTSHSSSCYPTHPHKRQLIEDKENQMVLRNKPVNSHHGQDFPDKSDGDDSIQTLISSLNNSLAIKDGKMPELMAVYERSLQALQTKEQHLQDLLEAKTLALTQADRMLAQYRSRKGQDEAEFNRLRSLLIQAEKRCEGLQHGSTDMQGRIDKYSKEVDDLHTENRKLQEVAKMHQQLTVVHTELTEAHESLQKSHQTLRQEHNSLTEMHEMLQKHNTNLKQQYDLAMEQLTALQDERRKISTQLKTSEAKLDDSKKAALKWEYDYKRSEEERETMEMSIEKLRSDLTSSESKNKQLLEKVSQLEFACSQNEAKITSYEEEIKELKTEVHKHRQIAALINSLSGGQPSDASMSNASKTSSTKGEH